MTPFFTVASRAALAPGRLAAAGSLVGRISSSSSSSRFVAMAPRVAPFSSSVRASAGSGPPVIQGEGAKPGEMPTDENQSTGLERLELLGRLEGVDVFDMEPLESHRKGTLKEPINVKSLFPTRIIGCTGSPAGAHDTLWLHLNQEIEHHRCPECGSVYQLEFTGDPHAGHH